MLSRLRILSAAIRFIVRSNRTFTMTGCAKIPKDFNAVHFWNHFYGTHYIIVLKLTVWTISPNLKETDIFWLIFQNFWCTYHNCTYLYHNCIFIMFKVFTADNVRENMRSKPIYWSIQCYLSLFPVCRLDFILCYTSIFFSKICFQCHSFGVKGLCLFFIKLVTFSLFSIDETMFQKFRLYLQCNCTDYPKFQFVPVLQYDHCSPPI